MILLTISRVAHRDLSGLCMLYVGDREERSNTRLGCVENVPAHQVGQGPSFRDTVVFQIVLYSDIVNDRGQGQISRTILVLKANKCTIEGACGQPATLF